MLDNFETKSAGVMFLNNSIGTQHVAGKTSANLVSFGTLAPKLCAEFKSRLLPTALISLAVSADGTCFNSFGLYRAESGIVPFA